MIKVKSADGTAIAVQREGRGPAIVLVTGALTAGAAFAPLARLLAPRFTVYAYDRRGRGESEDMQPYAVQREIEDLAAVITEAGGQAYVFGHSSGAILALETATAGLGIEGLVLYEPPFIVSGEPLAPDFADQLAALVTAGRRGDALALWMRCAVRMSDDAIAQARTQPWWVATEAIVHTTVYDATISAPYTRGQPLPAARWADLAVPTLVLNGEVTPPFLRTAAAALVETLPDATAQTLPGQGHGAPAEMIAPVLTTFFLDH